MFFEQVWVHFGIPRSIILDRDTIFLSAFWTTLQENIDTKLKRSTNIITTNTEYTIDPQSNIEKTTLYYIKPLRQGNTIQWILLWKGSSLVHFPFGGGIILLRYYSKQNTSLHIPLHCSNPFIQCYHHLRTFQRRNLLEVEPSKNSSCIYYI